MDASDTIYTKDEKYKMKSLKGHFAKTNILMIVISAALVITMSFILIFVFSLSNPDGFKTLFGTAKEVFSGSLERSQRYLYYFIIWAVLTGFTVLVTCLALSTNLARTVLTPIHRLKEAAENIAEGELDFDVLTSGDAEELAELCNSIERIRKKLKENAEHEHFQKEERNMLVANLSHDMRTPVTAIKGYIEGINDGIADTPEKQKQYLDTIYNKALVLEKLLDGMTEYSELELGRMQYVFEFVDITEYLRNVAEEYSAEKRVRKCFRENESVDWVISTEMLAEEQIVRLDPMEYTGIIQMEKAVFETEDGEQDLVKLQSNAIEDDQKLLIFDTPDPWIEYQLPEKCKECKIHFKFRILDYGRNAKWYEKFVFIMDELGIQMKAKDGKSLREDPVKEMEAVIEEQKGYIAHLEHDIQEQKEYVGHLERDIAELKAYIEQNNM